MDAHEHDLSEDGPDSDETAPFWHRPRTQVWMVVTFFQIALCALVMWLGHAVERTCVTVSIELNSVEPEKRPAAPTPDPFPPTDPVALTHTRGDR